MEFSSSPQATRRFTSKPSKSPTKSTYSDSIFDDDELSIVAQSPYFATQATQILDRPTLGPRKTIESSPQPAIEIEVPASSPFRAQSAAGLKKPTLGTMMAPAGTIFKNPTRQAAQTARPRSAVAISDAELNAPIYIIDDDSDDQGPARGDIRPSSFRSKEPTSVIDLTKEETHKSKMVSSDTPQRSDSHLVTES